MEFLQLSRIVRWEAGRQIVAERHLDADETLLRDHFPRFPVMPGVLMLEACYQAGMWLVLATEDFQPSMVVLKAAKNVKYSDFVAPGQTLTVTVDYFKDESPLTTLKASGVVSGPEKEPTQAFAARLVLERFSLADRYPLRGPTDPVLRHELRRWFERLTADPDSQQA